MCDPPERHDVQRVHQKHLLRRGDELQRPNQLREPLELRVVLCDLGVRLRAAFPERRPSLPGPPLVRGEKLHGVHGRSW